MNTCACAPAARTSVAFAHGIVMHRCRVHELLTWTVEGRPVETSDVRGQLKDLFVEERGQQRRASGPAADKVIRLSAPLERTAPADDATVDEQLTALLRSRGVQGSWATA